MIPKARASASQALSLDGNLAEAHNALAETKKNGDWDWLGAEVEYKRALALNPSYFLAHTWYAECLSRMERHDDAIALAKRARELDPVSTISNTGLGMLFYRARRFEEAIAACRSALEFGPHPNALWFQALALDQLGRRREAVAALERASEISPVPLFQAALAFVYARAGQLEQARSLLRQVIAQAQRSYVSPRDIALMHAGLQDANAAFQWLNRAFAERDLRVQGLTPEFDALRGDSRYETLIQRIRARGFGKPLA